MEKLYTAQAANDTSKGNIIVAKGTQLTVQAWGTWGGATVGVYQSVDGVTGVLISDLTFTANGIAQLQIAAGCHIWAEVSSAGTTSVNLWIAGQGND